MLILSRTPDESLRIGDNIIVHVISVKGTKVSIGIEAPIDQTVLRSELYDELKPEKSSYRSNGISALIADDLRLVLRKYSEGTLTHAQLIDSFQAALR